MSQADRLVGLASIFVLGISVQWIAWRIHFPSIVLLLCTGFIAGPVTGFLNPDALIGEKLLFPVVSICVALILFEGGLTLRIPELREVGKALWGLLTTGVVVTWILATAGAYYLLHFEFTLALLMGAILVVTGPTVVGPLLSHVRPIGRVGNIAKWEGIMIDPVGAVLAVLVLQSIESIHGAAFSEATLAVAIGLVKTAFTGLAMAIVGTVPIIFLMRRYLVPEFLQNPLLLMSVVASFTASQLLQHESGLLTVTLMGILVANQRAVDVKHIIEFKENLRVLLLSSLFIVLAARLDLSVFALLDWKALAFVAFMILIVRPASVMAATLGSDLTMRERIFLSWIAPRGIVAASVASVFALSLGDEGEVLVPVTFMVIVGTVVVYGTTLNKLARWLGLASPTPQGVLIVSAHPAARAIGTALQNEGFKVLLVDSNRYNASVARMEGLPSETADILADGTINDLDLGGIGRILCLTRNDEVNSLAALRFAEFFGRAEVYQLARDGDALPRSEKSPLHLRGRILFANHANYTYLDRRFANGAVIKRTKLTDEFTFKDFKEMYSETALPLFVVTEAGRLNISTADNPIQPKRGQVLIALVDPADSEPPHPTQNVESA